MNGVIIAVTLLSLIIVVLIQIRWNKISKNHIVDKQTIINRKKLRNIQIFLMVVFISYGFYAFEIITGEEMSAISSMILLGLFFGWNRTIFEPYYTTKAIHKLNNFSLYLRPFDFDSQSILKNRNGYTHGALFIPEQLEKAICSAINKNVGPVYAIGNPNSVSPTTLASSSIYASDSDWKYAVAELTRKAKLILIRIGDTDGCKWELFHCFENNYMEKIIFIADSVDDIGLLDSHSSQKIPDNIFKYDLNKSSIALFIENNQKWQYIVLNSTFDCDKLIKKYIESYSSL